MIPHIRATIALVLALCLTWPGTGCGADDDEWGGYSSPARAQLAGLVEAGLEDQLPPPLSFEEESLHEIVLHHRQVAGRLKEEVAAVAAPLAVALALFAVEGPADLLLAVFPAHKLGEGVKVCKDAIRLRKKYKRAPALAEKMAEFLGHIDEDARGFLRLAEKLSRAERRALRRIFRHTRSPAVVQALMRKHLERSADIRWIADRLRRGELDRDFVQRFSFDGDLVKDITQYSANLSWSTLERVVDGGRVDSRVRGALMRKLMGLLGERAAADIVRSKAFRKKYFKHDGSLAIRRGVSYGSKRNPGSIDIVALSDRDEMLFVEVKNWSSSTWSNKLFRKRVLDQLESHDRGVELIRANVNWPTTKGKVLMVREDGYLKGVREDERDAFEYLVTSMGWTIERMPDKRVRTTASFIDDLR